MLEILVVISTSNDAASTKLSYHKGPYDVVRTVEYYLSVMISQPKKGGRNSRKKMITLCLGTLCIFLGIKKCDENSYP